MQEIIDTIEAGIKAGEANAVAKSEFNALLYLDWIDAKKENPPPSEHGTQYLVILETKARAQHCKKWAGMGKPEIATWCSQWAFGWNARGSLSVAYWMPLPAFDMKWEANCEGESGEWV